MVNHLSCALHDAVKALTTQLSELQLQCIEKWSSTMQQQPWSEVVSGSKGNKGKGKGRVSSAGEMSGKVESKPAESKPTGKMGKSVNVSRASDTKIYFSSLCESANSFSQNCEPRWHPG